MCENLKRWETDTKYYKTHLYKDLFGCWILEKSWGSKFTRRGGGQLVCCTSYDDGIKKLNSIGKLRKKRGYHKTD
jgi:hypothetical protein